VLFDEALGGNAAGWRSRVEQQTAPYPLLKCITDKVVALVVLSMSLPILILIILVMTVSMVLRPADRGGLFYFEPRISRGRVFNLVKFRVLRQSVIARMPPDDKHARIYEADSSNLTWAGRYLLKRWYFDELPQLFNILNGDMTLVGPRPWPVPLVNIQLERGIIYRNLIRAGWTGPSQLQKGKPTPENSEKLDLEYLNRCFNWSNWRLWRYDCNILFQTIKVIMQGEGLAY
jgi:lipopolysaccharide/colanic/teichoic acid biosynthesis glycosyltransferase